MAVNWKKWQWRHNFPTWRHHQFFFDVILFLLSSLVTDPSLMSMLSLLLELWQFPFIREWPDIRKSEIPPFEFCPISGDWGKLGIPNLWRTSLIKCYWMLQNTRVTAFTVSELLRENQLRIKLSPRPSYPQWLTGYLGLSPVFMWSGAQREVLNFVSAQTDNFDFWNQIFPVKGWKSGHHHWIPHIHSTMAHGVSGTGSSFCVGWRTAGGV